MPCLDIGSNSIRLVVYDELGRAPCRASTRSPSAARRRPRRRPAASAGGFRRAVEAVRRFAPSRTRWGWRASTPRHGGDRAGPRTGRELVDGIRERPGSRSGSSSGEEEAPMPRSASSRASSARRGWPATWAAAASRWPRCSDDRVGERTVSMPLGALPVQSMLAEGEDAAKRRIDAILNGACRRLLTEPVFYAVGGGWRALARAHIAATRRRFSVVHGYEVEADEARASPSALAHGAGEVAALPACRPARRHPARGGDRALPRAQAAEARAGRLLGPRAARGLALRPARPCGAVPRPAARGRAIDRPAARARAASSAPALARWTDDLFPGETPADGGCGWRSAR